MKIGFRERMWLYMSNYTEFRKLLREAMGDMTQKEFATASKISHEHLSRMLNQEEIHRPSKTTLQKILSASTLVNPYDMYLSCGYSMDDCRVGVYKNRAGMTLCEHMQVVADDIQFGFQKMKASGRQYGSTTELMTSYLEKFAVDAKKITYATTDKEVLPSWDVQGDYVFLCVAKWGTPKDTRHMYRVETYFALGYVKTSKGNLLLTDVIVSPGLLLHMGFLPQHYVDMIVEDGVNPCDMPHFSIATEVCRDYSAEQRLLDAIFGKEDEPRLPLFHTIWGRGSIWEKTPDKFVPYLLANQDYFKSSEEEVEMVDEFTENPEADPDVVCKGYYFDGASGPAGVVLGILTRKFKDAGYDFSVDYDTSEAYDEVLKPVLYVSEDWYTHGESLEVEKMKLIDEVLRREFKALGLPTYGGTVAYKSYNVNPEEYVQGQEPLV